MHFCSRCGAKGDDTHLTGSCASARMVASEKLLEDTGVRCPIDGCTWRLSADANRSRKKALDTFYLHLEWHERTRTYAPEAPSEGASNAAALVDLVCTVLTARHSAEDVAAVRRVLFAELTRGA